MNDLQKELQELKAKVAELESRILFPNEPVAKWQPKGGDWCIGIEGDVFEFANNEIYYHFGTARKTKEQAQRASVEMRRFNRLLALRDELCGDDAVGRKDCRKVYFAYGQKIWRVSANVSCETITPYFTSYDLAQKACDMLNSGEVEL